MPRPGKRRGANKKSKEPSHETNQNFDDKVGNQADISSYFLKLKNNPIEDGQPSEVLTPCPDDAALPNSTNLGSVSTKEKKDIGPPNVHDDNLKETAMNCPNVANKETCDVISLVNDENGKNFTSNKKSKKQTGHLQNRQLTDFFPIRRSNRKTLCSLMKEKMKIVEKAVIAGTEEGFEIKEFPSKGRGIISLKAIKRGEFVLEYYGELINPEEAKKRELIYASKENTGCYMYYFKYKNKSHCIDATQETDRLGRLINHSKKGNLKTQTFLVKDSPRLVFLASKDIHEGEELLYDYGDRSKQAIQSHPWLAL